MINHPSSPHNSVQGKERMENFVEQRCLWKGWAEEARKNKCATKRIKDAHLSLHIK